MKSENKFKRTEIGTIPEDWGITNFGAILSSNIKHGVYKPKESVDSRGVRLLKMGDVNTNSRISDQNMERVSASEEEVERFRINNGNLIFARTSMMTGGLGNCSIVTRHTDPIIFDGNLLCAEINATIADPEFYFYYFKSKRGQNEIARMTTGTQLRNIPGSKLMEVNVPIPSRQEQTRIAAILSTLDSKIELNYQMNKTLEAIGHAIFKHWFTDFEFANEEGKPYRSSGGEMVYSKELGKEVPKGWKVKPFSEVIAINLKRELEHGPVAKKVGMADLNPWQAHIENWTCEEYKSGPKFKNGDTLFARITPSLEHGKTAFVSILDDNEVGFGSTEFIIFGKKVISSELYIFHLARSAEIRNIAIGAMTGTSGRQRVPDDLFDSLNIVIPLSALFDRFEAVVSPQFSRIACNAKVTRTLSQIRDSLLPKLMSGRIRVPVEVT